jgi:hypothetical protein
MAVATVPGPVVANRFLGGLGGQVPTINRIGGVSAGLSGGLSPSKLQKPPLPYEKSREIKKQKLKQLEKFKNTFSQSFHGSRFIDDPSSANPDKELDAHEFGKMILEEEHNVAKFKGQMKEDRAQIDHDLNLLKGEFNNIFEDLKVKMLQQLDQKHKDYFSKYATFKDKFGQYEAQLSALQQ